MQKQYGLPYMGSKNLIAEKVVGALPEAEILYDLFGGGGAISHCASLQSFMGKPKYGKVVYNELNPLVANGFEKAIKGGFKDERRWIGREEFNRLKGTDFYVACCFSFGNDYRTYAYGREIEPYKKAYHMAVMELDIDGFKDICGVDLGAIRDIEGWNERRLLARSIIAKEYKAGRFKYKAELKEEQAVAIKQAENLARVQGVSASLNIRTAEGLENIERLSRLTLKRALNHQTMESLGRVGGISFKQAEQQQNMERLQAVNSVEAALETRQGDYRTVKVEGGIAYCDIPYIGTKKYNAEFERAFDFEEFCQWCSEQTAPVYVSSYELPEKLFKEVASWSKRGTMSACANNEVSERLYEWRR